MTPIDKPSCMPDRDSLPEAITNYGCDLVEFYDEFLEGRTISESLKQLLQQYIDYFSSSRYLPINSI